MKKILLLLFLSGNLNGVMAQSLPKEAMNNYAMFTNSGDIKNLETARKNIDDAYATRKDSALDRHNLIRSLIYSTLAFVDSNRTFSYKKDPIEETLFSLSKLTDPEFNEENEQEINHVKKQLSQAYLVKANKALSAEKYEDALEAYKLVDSMEYDDTGITHNMAILNERLGNAEEAILLYEKLIDEKPKAEYYMILANLYEADGQINEMLRILQSGRQKYPAYRDLIFKEVNTYADNEDYGAVIEVIDEALKFDEADPDLNYLAGFSYEMTGDRKKAESFYKKILDTEPNNYEATYALGLLYLNIYIINKQDAAQMEQATAYLIKANEIKPNDIKSLRSLVILYKNNGNQTELNTVNSKLNELLIN